MIEITSGRTNPLIDPHLEIWEWQIPAYLFLGGLVAGLMILNGIWRLSNKDGQVKASVGSGAIWAPILLSLGMLFLWLDLAYKLHVFKFYMAFKITSPMSWGSWILLFVYPVQILTLALPNGWERFDGKLSFLAPFNPVWDQIKTFAKNFARPIAISSIVLGIMLGIYTGILLSASAARPLWNSALLGPLFLTSGLSAATAWNLLSRPTHLEEKSLVRWDIGLLVLELVFLLLILIGMGTGSESQQHALKLLTGGQFTAAFWVLVVAVGILLPLWLEIREATNRYVPSWLGPLFVLIGGLMLRFVIVEAGQVSHIIETELLSTIGH